VIEAHGVDEIELLRAEGFAIHPIGTSDRGRPLVRATK
jgi:hypothetical protein